MELLPPPPDLYRPNVGLLVFNQDGKAWIGRRRGFRGAYCWQTPQGGIDHGERVVDAALRELTEETGIDSSKVEILARTNEWLCYDFPESMRKSKLNHYKGQAQIWYAMRFNGDDNDIKLDGHKQIEFDDWRWEKPALLPDLVVPFKRGVYLQVIEHFARFAA